MADRRLVIDANIVIRAVFGVRVRTLIEQNCETTAFYIAEANLEEAIHYVAELGEKRVKVNERVILWRNGSSGLSLLGRVVSSL